MKDVTYLVKEPLAKGLAPKNNVRNQPLLVEAIGCVPENGVLKALDSFSALSISGVSGLSGVSFPYPQLFVLSDVTIVCSSTEIYEYNGSTFTSKISGLTAGTTWSCVDFKSFIYFTNGKVAVKKSPASGAYTQTADLPYAVAACNINGQVLIGSPNTPASGAI